MREPITHDRLLDRLHYDPETGVFTWRSKKRGRGSSQIAGKTDPSNYSCIGIDRGYYKAHRLAWFYVHGVWPSQHLDHIDGSRSNNAIANLRLTDGLHNSANRGKNRNNTSGVKGVVWHKGAAKWMARVQFKGRGIYLGIYDDIEQAKAAYIAGARHYFGEFARAA